MCRWLRQFFLFSMIGGIRHPLVVAACGILWSYARPKWAEGYASGKPESRYTHKAAVLVWTCRDFPAQPFLLLLLAPPRPKNVATFSL